MHIPDGFLSPPVLAGTWALSTAGLGIAFRRVRLTLEDRAVPLLGVTAAFVFAAQMVNFPVMAGTSGHLLGGVFSSLFLGPAAAAAVMATVLCAQCLLFQDGGLVALGANLLNMGLLGTAGGYAALLALRRLLPARVALVVPLAAASWLSVMLSAGACALQLALSGVAPLSAILPALLGVHALIGAGEALITCAIAGFVLRVRPDLLHPALARKAPHVAGAS